MSTIDATIDVVLHIKFEHMYKVPGAVTLAQHVHVNIFRILPRTAGNI